MSASLARRIRRIGLLPTTYKESTETYLAKNEEGKEVTKTRTKKTPIRHNEVLSGEDRSSRAAGITADWRNARRLRKSKGLVTPKAA